MTQTCWKSILRIKKTAVNLQKAKNKLVSTVGIRILLQMKQINWIPKKEE